MSSSSPLFSGFSCLSLKLMSAVVTSVYPLRIDSCILLPKKFRCLLWTEYAWCPLHRRRHFSRTPWIKFEKKCYCYLPLEPQCVTVLRPDDHAFHLIAKCSKVVRSHIRRKPIWLCASLLQMETNIMTFRNSNLLSRHFSHMFYV